MTLLEELLQRCTVKIIVPGGWGTGFFVAPGLILTCTHVVRKAADLQITVFYPASQQTLSAIVKVKADDGKTLDLALVELSESLSDHPCVLLGEEPVAISQALYSYGYLESYTNAAPVRPVNEGLTGDTPPLLKLQGAQIEKGISGAALLNLKTGKVCGMVKETRATGFDLGGGAIPTRVILEQFPELRELQRKFHECDLRWRDRVASAAPTSQTVSQTSSQINSGGTNYQTQTGTNNINYIGETHIYAYPASPPDAHVAADELQRYLQAVAVHYEKWQEVYTLMDAKSRSQKKQKAAPLFDFGLMAEPLSLKDEIEQDDVPDAQAEIERFPVLEGLQKYLFQEHVLLVGRPGSGKSTTLARLMLELAKDEQIPILVELRLYESSILELIRLSCKRHGLNLKTTQIEMLLDDRKLILLVDGVNELPLKFEKNLLNFCHNYPKVPMVFTTRDADLYGGLGIERKLEIQPLTELQMRSFAQKYLSKQADKMLRQLKDRLQEFRTTPLLLWLLCSLFEETKQIPQNLGEMFRLFTNSYEKKIKQDIVPEVDRRFWRSLLKQLAATMIQNDKSPAISQTEVCEVFSDNLKALEAKDPLVSNKALDDLLNHHLIQRNGDLIEFRHQLIQEYYAAEWLLDEIGTLDGKTLDSDYLNYLKWTEPLALMLSLMEDKDEAKVLWVVERALAVDLMLGARLSGEVRSKKLQQRIARNTIKTIQHLINYPGNKKTPDIGFEIYLLSLTKSKIVLGEIVNKKNRYNDRKSRIILASVMDHFGEPAIYALHFLQKDNDPQIRALYAKSLSKIPSEKSIHILFNLLDDASPKVQARSILSLSDLLIEMRIREYDYLEKFYKGLDLFLAAKDLNLCKSAIIALAKLSADLSQKNCECLDNFFLRIDSILKHSEPEIRRLGVTSLTKITIRLAKYFPVCCEQFFARIDSMLEDSDSDVYNLAICSLAKVSLDLGKDVLSYPDEFFSRIDLILLDTSRLSDSFKYVIIKMRELGSEQAIEKMRELLTIDGLGVIAATNLADIRSEESLNPLIEALNSSSYRVRENAVRGLYYAGSEQKCPYLINAVDRLIGIINDSRSHIPGVDKLRRLAIVALVNIGSEAAMDVFAAILRDQQFISLHPNIVEYLGKFNSSKSIELLIELGLVHSNSDVRRKSFVALRKLVGEEELIATTKGTDCESEFYQVFSCVPDLDIERERRENKSNFSRLLSEIVDRSRQIDSSNGATYAREIWEKSQELWKENVEIIDLAKYLPDLKDAWLETRNKGIRRILCAIQSKCKFYNYEIFQAHQAAQKGNLQNHPNSNPNATTIQTKSVTIMTDKSPIFNQPHAIIGVNYAAEGSKIEVTQHTSSSEQTFEILLTDYEQFIEQLQQKYPTLADPTTVPQIIEVEAKLIEAQDQHRWQNFLNLKRLWNGGKKAGIKIGEHFAENNIWAKGAIAFLEGVSENGK